VQVKKVETEKTEQEETSEEVFDDAEELEENQKTTRE
jgi:hypothetical protein